MHSTWEYLVINVNDKWGGLANIEQINIKLNELGSKGWHLVTAYTNEMGKNAISLKGVGLNSTIDQNIFIFEREVSKGTEEEKRIEKRLNDFKNSVANSPNQIDTNTVKEESESEYVFVNINGRFFAKKGVKIYCPYCYEFVGSETCTSCSNCGKSFMR
ncbi:MAG: DUF4177 domain-containing protein [Spirochaetaceae bacterium]|nr:DUF4177 domain-containing protein [Spirochaetaceae bacterium]